MESTVTDEKVVNLSGHGLKKIPRNLVNDKTVNCLEISLNNNEIQKLEFLSGFQCVEKFVASHNQLLRMYGVQSFKHLVYLDLSYNKIICIEGLREMPHLQYLSLGHNKIKDIDHTLQKNSKLEYVDISANIISNISNLSHLTKLKSLMLHDNLISSLRHCELYLPKSLEKLTLAGNKITDLNEVCHLVELINLKEISLASNPCVDSTGQAIGVEYRPFLVNWCLALKVIDGYAVNDMECLKGEWLYSQGKGRKFRPGEHNELVQYLAENIPFTGDHLDSEQDRKLRLILSKAREHKSPLNPQLGPGKTVGRETTSIMTRSLDPSLFMKTTEQKQTYEGGSLSRSLHCTSLPSEKEAINEDVSAPLPAASKLVPVPESLVSPMVANIPDIPLLASKECSVSKEPQIEMPSSEMQSTSKLVKPNEDSYPPQALDKIKLQSIKNLAEEMKVKKTLFDNRGETLEIDERPQLHTLQSNISHHNVSMQTLPTPRFGQDIVEKDELISRAVKSVVDIFKTTVPSRENVMSTPFLKNKKSSESLYLTASSSSGSINSQKSVPSSYRAEFDESTELCEQSSSDDSKDRGREEAVKHVVSHLVDQIELNYARTNYSLKRDHAATRIQKVWRGYRTRSQHNVHSLVNSLELRRVHEHVVKLAGDVEGVKVALENEHKVHVLQIQAINGLWRKLNAMQSVQSEEPPEIKDLSETCERLNTQVQQLQVWMQEVMRYVGRCASPTGSCVSTQTDITAVHTPCDESLSLLQNRPSSLPITAHRVTQYAENLVGDALKDTVIVPSEDNEN